MLAELLEQNHRQQVCPRPSPGDHMERCGCLADLLTVLAGEFLSHCFDHLPLAWDRFESAGHVLTQFAQSRSATTVTRRRRINHHALARKVLGEGVAFGAL